MSRAILTTRSTAQAQLLTERPAWKALAEHYQTVRGLHLRQLFAEDSRRGERLSAEAAGIYLDYSKNRITDEPQLKHDSSTNALIRRYRRLRNGRS